MADQGNIAEKPVAEIFRELAAQGRGGVLRLVNGKQIKVIVFEEGRPVFAISNVPEDQLDVLLVRQRLLTVEQAKSVKSQIQKEQEFGRKVIEMGLLKKETTESVMLDQVSRIIYSVASWVEGQYLLDTSARVPHDVTLATPITQFLLDAGSRVPPDTARTLLGPPTATFNLAAEAPSIDAMSMGPTDSFLMTRINRPMTVDEICAESGLVEDQVLSSLYGLYAAGLVARTSASGGASAQAAGSTQAQAEIPPEVSTEELHADLDRTLSRMKLSDHYEILGAPRNSTSGEIKKAYYALAKLYHPDRFHQASDPEIRDKLEAVFGMVSRAYDVLKDDRQREEYDRRLGPASATPIVMKPVVPIPQPAASRSTSQGAPSRPLEQPAPAPRPRAQSAPLSTPPSTPPTRPVAQAAEPAPSPQPVASSRPGGDSAATGITNEQLAEHNYNEGLKRLERKDVMGAIPVLREAVRLNPDKGIYHYHLGSALCINPRWYKEAEKHLLEAARTEPFNVQIFLKLGQLYQESNLPKRAESQYRAALSLDPYNKIARQGLIDMGLDVPEVKGSSKTSKKDDAGGGFFSKLFKRK